MICRDLANRPGRTDLLPQGAFAAGASSTLADIVPGLSVNRGFTTPMARPALAAVAADYDALATRPGFLLHGRNGTP